MDGHRDVVGSDHPRASKPILTGLAELHNTKDETVVGHGEYQRPLAVQDGAEDTEVVELSGFQNGTRGTALREVCDLSEETEEPRLRGFHYPNVEVGDTVLSSLYNCEPEAADASRATSEPCGIQATGSAHAGAVISVSCRPQAELASSEFSEPRTPEADEAYGGHNGEVHGSPGEMEDVQVAGPRRLEVIVERRELDALHAPVDELRILHSEDNEPGGLQPNEREDQNVNHKERHGSPRVQAKDFDVNDESFSRHSEASSLEGNKGVSCEPEEKVGGRELSEPSELPKRLTCRCARECSVQ